MKSVGALTISIPIATTKTAMIGGPGGAEASMETAVLFISGPDEFEAVHSHTFRVKTFKKSKHCGVCKQTVSKEGLICRGGLNGKTSLRSVFLRKAATQRPNAHKRPEVPATAVYLRIRKHDMGVHA
ncbi:hypothetical protein MHYP_G00065010 [Metynnis hypsauchen]